MEQTYKIAKTMANIRSIFDMSLVNMSVGFDMWEKLAKVYPHSKRITHYEEKKLIKYENNIQNN